MSLCITKAKYDLLNHILVEQVSSAMPSRFIFLNRGQCDLSAKGSVLG